MSDPVMQRASLLLQSGRAEEALEYVSQVLQEDPDRADAHAFQALALSDLGDHGPALEAAERARGMAPEWAFPPYVQAQVQLQANKPKRALLAAQEAVALEPEDEAHHGMEAACYVGLSRYKEGLAAAERGLALDPTDTHCTNLRALCLRQLGQLDEATSALESSLEEDPENAWTHQNLGFAAVADGRYDDAIESFRESLRLDPTDEAARTGLGMALKGKVPLYRPLIAWQLFSSKLSGKVGFGLIIGLLVLNRVVQMYFGSDSLVGGSVLVFYVSFVWMSWAGNALFDVLLLCRRDLRPILTGREQVASVGVVLCVAMALVSLGVFFSLRAPGFQWIAGAFAFAAIPMAAWPAMGNDKARTLGIVVAAAASMTALAGFALGLYAMSLIQWDMGLEGPKAEMQALGERFTAAINQSGQLFYLSVLISVGASWLMPMLGIIPEASGSRGKRRRPRT